MAVPRYTQMASDVRFADIQALLRKHGWELARIKGSHHYFTGPDRRPISIPVHRGKVKDVYRKQVERAIRELEREEDDA